MSTNQQTKDTTVLPIVPVANYTRVSYFRDEANPHRVLTVVRRLSRGFVEVGWALCKPDSIVPFEGKLYRRTTVPVEIDETERRVIEAVDKKFGSDKMPEGFEVETAPPANIPPPEGGDQVHVRYIPQFVPVFITEGFIFQKGDSFKRSEGRRLATERLNDPHQCVVVLARKNESVLYTALRGLRDNDQTFNGAQLVPDRVKDIAENVISYLDEEEYEENLARSQGRKPFWSRMKDGFKSLFG